MVAARAGHIILIASAGVFGAFHSYSAYNPSKAAVASLGDILHLELTSFGIKVTTAFPPDTDTPQLHSEKSKRSFVAARLLDGMPVMSAKRVAHDIVAAARAGRRHAVPGLGTRLFQMFPGLFGAMFRRRQLRLAKLDPSAGHQ
jgi:3-dehydrosphinganine reductase